MRFLEKLLNNFFNWLWPDDLTIQSLEVSGFCADDFKQILWIELMTQGLVVEPDIPSVSVKLTIEQLNNESINAAMCGIYELGEFRPENFGILDLYYAVDPEWFKRRKIMEAQAYALSKQIVKAVHEYRNHQFES